MDALDNILKRVSARELAEPHPTESEMKKVYKFTIYINNIPVQNISYS